ncbi:MAG: ATP-binding protein [Planctomycetota bacterium]|jgi:anti-sigma regulatory factor (Ser/Thr protein kinase)
MRTRKRIVAKLKLVVSNRVVEYHELQGRAVLGRSRDADVLIVDPAVSREHSIISQDGQRFYIEDLGSANGTLVNGERITREALTEGDVIQIGDTAIVFTFEDLAVDAEREVTVDGELPPMTDDIRGARDLLVHLPGTRDMAENFGEWAGELLETSCLNEEEQHYFRMALHEALGNAWRHGNAKDAAKQVHVRLLRDENRVVCRVRDEGEGFNFREALESGKQGDAIRAARDRYESGGMGGLGIMLIIKCMDLVEFNERGNEITLTKCPGETFQTKTVYGGVGFQPEDLPPRDDAP